MSGKAAAAVLVGAVPAVRARRHALGYHRDHMAAEGKDSLTVIRPYGGAGPIDFSMSRDEVDAILGPPLGCHDDWGPGTVCSYGRPMRFRITFDEAASHVEIIEIVDDSAVVEGVRLTGSYSAVRDVLAGRGAVAQVDLMDGFPSGNHFFQRLGIALWTEDPDGDTIDAVGVWRRDAFQRDFGAVEGMT